MSAALASSASAPILVADIGATNARFALAVGGLLHERRTYPSASLRTGIEAIEAYLSEARITVSGAALAIAGPVVGDPLAGYVGAMTNRPLTFSSLEIALRLRLERVVVINDFVAVAAAIPGLSSDEQRLLGPREPTHATKGVLGPGTGLGMSMLLPLGDRWAVVASEGGNCDLAATDPLEAELSSWLRGQLGHVSWETVLSGPGLVNLYRATCALWGAAPERDEPRAIVEAALDAEDPVCHQTLETFCNLLGTAAGNLALTACGEGGVYLAGGIVPRLVDFLAASHFRRRFEERGPLSAYVQRIATIAVIGPDIGLSGAARAFHGERMGNVLGVRMTHDEP